MKKFLTALTVPVVLGIGLVTTPAQAAVVPPVIKGWQPPAVDGCRPPMNIVANRTIQNCTSSTHNIRAYVNADCTGSSVVVTPGHRVAPYLSFSTSYNEVFWEQRRTDNVYYWSEEGLWDTFGAGCTNLKVHHNNTTRILVLAD